MLAQGNTRQSQPPHPQETYRSLEQLSLQPTPLQEHEALQNSQPVKLEQQLPQQRSEDERGTQPTSRLGGTTDTFLERKREPPELVKYDSTFAPYQLDTTSAPHELPDVQVGVNMNSASTATGTDMDDTDGGDDGGMHFAQSAPIATESCSDFKQGSTGGGAAVVPETVPGSEAVPFPDASEGFLGPPEPRQHPSDEDGMDDGQDVQQLVTASRNDSALGGSEPYEFSSCPSPVARTVRCSGDAMPQMAYFQLGAPSRGSGGRMSRGSGFLSRGSGQMVDIPSSDEPFDFNDEDEPPQLKYFTREPHAALNRLSGSGRPPRWSGNMSDVLVTPSSARNSLNGSTPFGGSGNLYIPELAGALGARGSFNGGVSPLGLGFSTPVSSPRFVVPSSEFIAPNVGSMSMSVDPLSGAKT